MIFPMSKGEKFMRKYSAVIGMLLFLCFTGCGAEPEAYVNEDFLSENTTEIRYETKEHNISWGSYQSEVTELAETSVVLMAGGVGSTTKKEVERHVKACKKKLDLIQVPYAFGYWGSEGTQVSVQMDAAKIGVPVLALLNVSHRQDRAVASQTGAPIVTGVTDFTAAVNANGGYDFRVKIPESEIDQLNDFCKGHRGETLYLKLGDLLFSKCRITEGTNGGNLVFENMIFLGEDAKQTDYESLVTLAEYVMNTDDRELYPIRFPLDADRADYGIPYVTEDLSMQERNGGSE